GTSVIAREFSPGKPQPTLIRDVRQFTLDSNKNTLEFDEKDEDDVADEQAKLEAERIRQALQEEIAQGAVEVVTENDRVVIHILENASFQSGDDTVRYAFRPTLKKIARLLETSNGEINVAGHTDNIPISTSRFRSNWELSTSRAISVAHLLLDNRRLARERFVVTGHADTKPRAPNDSGANRAVNRRVDIRIVVGEDQISDTVMSTNDAAAQQGDTQ
ncbi:MAG: OmpA family protein, partial [Pseudomonadota bacterium]